MRLDKGDRVAHHVLREQLVQITRLRVVVARAAAEPPDTKAAQLADLAAQLADLAASHAPTPAA